MVTLYFISGLGSDERIFRNLRLDKCEIRYLKWIIPKKNEPMDSYVNRLAEQVQSDCEFILIGLSFGGIIAQELAKIVNPSKVVLISSIKHQNEKPFYVNLVKKLQLYKFIPFAIVKFLTPLFYHNMGATTKEEKELIKEFVWSTEKRLFKWSVKQIAIWENSDSSLPIYHIHGDADRILPIKYIKSDYIIKRGSHFMVYNKAGDISKIIRELFSWSS